MKYKSLQIKKLGYMALLLPLIEPASFDQIIILDLLFNCLKLISFSSVILLYIKKCRMIDMFMLAVIFSFFIPVISTAFQGGWVYSAVVQMISITTMILLVKMLLVEDPVLCFDVILPLLEVLIYANLVSIIIFPDGMYKDVVGIDFERYRNWILGLDNGHVQYYIAGMAVTVVRDFYKLGGLKISLRSWRLILACYISMLICWPATAVVGMAIILSALVMPKLFTKSTILNIVNYFIVIMIFFFAIIIFRMHEHFAFLIQDVLHKSLSFSGRTFVWDRAISVFLENPILGIGVWRQEKIWGFLGQIHAHNIFLQELVSGGIIQLVLYLYMNIMILMKLMKNNHNGIACLLSVFIFSMLLMNQMEIYQSGLWFLIYLLAYNSDKIIARQQEYQLIRNNNGFQVPLKGGTCLGLETQ